MEDLEKKRGGKRRRSINVKKKKYELDEIFKDGDGEGEGTSLNIYK